AGLTAMLSPDIQTRLSKIKLLALDVDGVLTDGRIIYGDHGDELKFFDVQDGFSIAMIQRAGIPVVVISAKKSPVNRRRAKELGIQKLYQNVKDKYSVFEKVLKKMRL